MSQAVLRKLVTDVVTTALETQTATMTEADNSIREINVAKRGNYKEFISCQPFYFNGMEGVVGLIRCMISNNEKIMEVFIGGLARSIEGNVTASKPQTLEEAVNIAQRTSVTITQMISVNNKIEGQKLSDPMLLFQLRTVDILETVRCVRDVTYITQDLAQSSVESATSFDIVIGMDWISKYHAKIIYDEKVVHIPIEDETLIIQAQVMEKKSDDKRLGNIPVVKEFPDVFPEELPCLPLVRQVEFQIDLIPGIAPVARAPYRLAPSEMQELSNQHQELADR
nr:putative reverse transcriptase domain-containing protein [Tanacetum cinerariifolium]